MPIHPDTIRHAITVSAITKADLARRAGLHANTLRGVENEDWNPRWATLCRLHTVVEEIKRERA